MTRHSIPWVATEMPAFDDDVWELYGPDDWTQAHDSPGDARQLHELQRLLLERPRSTTCCRSTTVDSSASTRTSQGVHSSSAAVTAPLRRHGTPVRELDRRRSRTSRIASRRRSTSRRRRRRRDHRPGRGFGGWRSTRRTGSRRSATTSSACSSSRSTATIRSPPASTRCGWSSRTTAAGSGKAATSTSTSTASGRRGACRRHRPDALLRRRDDATRSDTATTVSDDYGPQDSEFTGRVPWCSSTSTRPPRTSTT